VALSNQYQGGGNPGNQLQDGSAVSFKQATDTTWTTVPMVFATSSVAATSASNAWAVGYTNGKTLIERWNGTAWKRVSLRE
jgi:hypothetical protein